MPIYEVTSPDGRTLSLDGPSPPSEAELDQIFATVRQPDFKTETIGHVPLIDRALEALPAVGGMTGGMIGGAGGTAFGMGFGGIPGALGGAAFGGATGEAVKQLGKRILGREAPATPQAAAGQIGMEGATQGALEGAGQGMGAGLAAGGRVLLENAVRPSMTLLREFPNVMSVIEKGQFPVGRFLPFLRPGSQQAGSAMGEAAGAVRALLTKAEQAGTTFPASDVAQPVLSLVDDIAKQPLAQADQRRLSRMLSQFLDEHPGPLTPNAVKDLKQRAQAIAKPIFSAQQKGFPVSADQPLTARFNQAIAKGAKNTLETIPGVAQGEKRTQDLIGAQRALKQAEGRRLPLAVEGISASAATVAGLLGPDSSLDSKVKNGVTAYLVARGLGSPRTLSRAGIALTTRQMTGLARQFPRFAEAVIAQSRAGAPPTAGTAAP